MGFRDSTGENRDELIERELVSASCVVVSWSAMLLAKSWVKTEAAEALARGVLVPVLIEAVAPPLAFRQIQAAPLMDWQGDLDHAGFQQLVCSICALAGPPVRAETKDKKKPVRSARPKEAAGQRGRRPGAQGLAAGRRRALRSGQELPRAPHERDRRAIVCLARPLAAGWPRMSRPSPEPRLPSWGWQSSASCWDGSQQPRIKHNLPGWTLSAVV